MTYTAAQKRTAIRREIGKRRSVYKRLVESGGMKQEEATYQIAIFEAIEADYVAQVEAEKKATELPGL